MLKYDSADGRKFTAFFDASSASACLPSFSLQNPLCAHASAYWLSDSTAFSKYGSAFSQSSFERKLNPSRKNWTAFARLFRPVLATSSASDDIVCGCATCNWEIRSEGSAKLTLCPPVICNVAMLITWPCMFTTGLPLDPADIGAVVGMMGPKGGM